MFFSLQDKVAVITGAGSGIGLATSKRFQQAGAKLVLADITEQSDLAKELGGIFVKTDVSVEGDVKNLMEKAEKQYGKIDIIINNAGIVPPGTTIDKTEAAVVRRVFDVNALGVLYGLKYGPAHMNDGGAIVNTASLAGKTGTPEYAAYGSSKAAVIELTRTAAVELSLRNIRVNCVCPTTVDTPQAYAEGCEPELLLVEYSYPLGRMAKAEELASCIHFLAADDCSYITGVDLDVDGGYRAGPSLRNMGFLLEALAPQE